MQKRSRILLLAALGLAAFCIGLFWAEAETKVLRRWVDDALYDNWNHYLPCEQLPALSEVERVIAAHQDTIRQIEAVSPGLVGYDTGSPCPGRGDIVFWYGSRSDRRAIEAIIAGDMFFGIPYRLNNR